MFDIFDNEFGEAGYNINPAYPTLAACGYDRHCYISTAKILPSPYTSQPLIQAKIGGLIKLIESVDDSQPPLDEISGDALVTYNSVIQNVVTEINGYLSSIYPIPLVQTGTVAVIQVTGVSDDGLGTITDIKVLDNGNYLAAPNVDNFPAYLRYIDPLANVNFWGETWFSCQQGTGAELAIAYQSNPYSDESGQTLQAQSVLTAAITNGGKKYRINDLLVLTGGQSFVPAKVREAALDLICHSLYQRRLAPDEKNPFNELAKMWRTLLLEIGHGEQELDGTYKRSFSIGACWGTRSVIGGANSL